VAATLSPSELFPAPLRRRRPLALSVRGVILAAIGLVVASFQAGPVRAAEPTIYTVQPGDSLNHIALQMGSTVRAIMAANSLNTSYIFGGQSLIIPSMPGEIYSVVPGDTLVELSRRHDTSVASIMRANSLSSTTIFAGQRLSLPSGTAPFPPLAPPLGAAKGHQHVVGRGESATLLAAEHSTSLLAIVAMNNMSSTGVFVGQSLAVPPPCLSDHGSLSVGHPDLIWPSDSANLTGSSFADGHNGVDIGAPSGSPVYAAASGQVAYQGWTDWGYGGVVVLSHSRGWQTLYAHLSDGLATCGEHVSQGELIGFSGSSGNASGPHLHFEALFRGIHVNPLGHTRPRGGAGLSSGWVETVRWPG